MIACATGLAAIVLIVGQTDAGPAFFAQSPPPTWLEPITFQVAEGSAIGELSGLGIGAAVVAAYNSYRAISTASLPPLTFDANPFPYSAGTAKTNFGGRNVVFVDQGNAAIEERLLRGVYGANPIADAKQEAQRTLGLTHVSAHKAVVKRGLANFWIAISSTAGVGPELDQILQHEVGHVLGIGHSGLVRRPAPPGPTSDWPIPRMRSSIVPGRYRTPFIFVHPDEHAWVSALYPSNRFSKEYGRVSGTVTLVGAGSSRPACGVAISAIPLDSGVDWSDGAVSSIAGFGGKPVYDLPLPPGRYSLSAESIYSKPEVEYNRYLGTLRVNDPRACDGAEVLPRPVQLTQRYEVNVEVGRPQIVDIEIEIQGIVR